MSVDMWESVRLAHIITNAAMWIKKGDEIERLKDCFRMGVHVLDEIPYTYGHTTLFTFMCQRHRPKILRWVLENHLNLPEHQPKIFNGLTMAVSRGLYGMCVIFLDAIPNIREAEDANKVSLLNLSLRVDKTNIAYLLIRKGVHLCGRSYTIREPIIYSIQYQQPPIFKKLMSLGVEVKNIISYNPIIHEVLDEIANLTTVYEMIEMLLKAGVNPNAPRMRSMETPLYRVCKCNMLALAQLLLSYGADKNAPRYDGRTPFKIARLRGNHEIVKLLENHPFSLQALCQINLMQRPATKKRTPPTPVPFTMETRSKRQRKQ